MNKFKLSIILLVCFAAFNSVAAVSTVIITSNMSLPDSIHKFWKWKSFISLTRASVNIRKFDLDMRLSDTVICHSYNESIISMYSLVEDAVVQKNRNTLDTSSSKTSRSAYHIIGNTIVIENQQKPGFNVTYQIVEITPAQLTLNMHLKLRNEDGEQREGDIGKILFTAQGD